VKRTIAGVAPFLLLFALLYAAFGVASPFLPALMQARGLSPELIGIVFGSATAIRLLSAPVARRIADRTHALRGTLAVCCGATALAALGYLPATGLWPLLAITLLYALALAPTTNLADALALVASRRQGFEYGWVRGAGSAAFIAASILAGFAVSGFDLGVVVILQAALMLTVPLALRAVPSVNVSHIALPLEREGLRALVGSSVFRRVVLVEGPPFLITFQSFVPIRWFVQCVPPNQHGARLLGVVQAKKEISEAQDRARTFIAPPPNRLWKGVIGAVREGVAINNQQQASRRHRFRNQSRILKSRLISSEVASGM
jgi:MFS family permease